MEKYLKIADEILNLVDVYSNLDAVCEIESDDFANWYEELQHWIADIIKENFNI